MNKQEFLARLREGLSGLPQDDVAERLTFYGEIIDDRVEDGLSEEAAAAEIGPVDEIVSQTIAEIPLPKLVRERVRPKRPMRAWEIALLATGSPLWLSLLIAALAVLLSLYIVIWAVILSLWAVEASFAVCSLGGAAAGLWLVCRGGGLPGLCMISAGLVLAGLSVFLFFGCRETTKGALLLTGRLARGTKSLLIRKESAQ